MDETRRWRAVSRVAYSHAVLAVIQYARDNLDADFYFGPLSVQSMEAYGLVVSGPGAPGVAEVLSRIPGLSEMPA